jgi:hypothetical protein
MERDGVFFDDKERLDEVCGEWVHLEKMGRGSWFLLVGHADGTESAFWFRSRDLEKPFWETREPRPKRAG